MESVRDVFEKEWTEGAFPGWPVGNLVNSWVYFWRRDTLSYLWRRKGDKLGFILQVGICGQVYLKNQIMKVYFSIHTERGNRSTYTRWSSSGLVSLFFLGGKRNFKWTPKSIKTCMKREIFDECIPVGCVPPAMLPVCALSGVPAWGCHMTYRIMHLMLPVCWDSTPVQLLI